MSEPEKPLTAWEALQAPEFWLLGVAALVSGCGVQAIIVIPVCMVGLLIASLPKYGGMYERARKAGADGAFWTTVAASIINALCASVAAFALGRFVWWVSGL